MALTFYYGSGSPVAWKIWLALEHKQIPYQLKVLSFERRELKTPEYLAINPRGKVPAIVDGDFALYESSAIAEYLEERHPERPLLPRDPQRRAIARRVAAESDHYLYAAVRRLVGQTLTRPPGGGDATEIAAAQTALVEELGHFARGLSGDHFAGELSIADFAVYPLLRMIRRIDERQPQHGLGERFPHALGSFMRHLETLPYVEKTAPPHWKG
jgi:glutathione S-transferase